MCGMGRGDGGCKSKKVIHNFQVTTVSLGCLYIFWSDPVMPASFIWLYRQRLWFKEMKLANAIFDYIFNNITIKMINHTESYVY